MPFHTFMIGDHLDRLEEIAHNSVDLVISSPPYGFMRDYKGYRYEFEDLASLLYLILKEGGRLVWVVRDQKSNFNLSGQAFEEFMMFKEVGFRANEVIVKKQKGFSFPSKEENKSYHTVTEFVFVFSRGVPAYFDGIKDVDVKQKGRVDPNKHHRQKDGSMKHQNKAIIYHEKKLRSNVWEYSVGYNHSAPDFKKAHKHPAIMPLQLAEDLIVSYCPPGGLVLDPMGGSGTVTAAAEKLGRNSIYVDISEEYTNLAKERLDKMIQKGKVKSLEGLL